MRLNKVPVHPAFDYAQASVSDLHIWYFIYERLPYSFGMNGSEAELKAVFEQKFEEIKQQRLNKTGNVDE